jgi:hypothetical protein
MPTLIAYTKASDAYTTYQLTLPDTQGQEPAGYEIAALSDGRTVVVLGDGHTLPEQPEQIADSVEILPSPLPQALREEIKAASPHAKLIDERVVQRIRDVYSVSDEIGLLRAGSGPEYDAWVAHVEACRAWGREQRALIGL